MKKENKALLVTQVCIQLFFCHIYLFISESFLLSRKIKENPILSSGHIFFAPLALAGCCSSLPLISLQDFPFIKDVLCCLWAPDILIAPQVIQLKPVRNLIDWTFWLENVNWKNKWTKSEWIFYCYDCYWSEVYSWAEFLLWISCSQEMRIQWICLNCLHNSGPLIVHQNHVLPLFPDIFQKHSLFSQSRFTPWGLLQSSVGTHWKLQWVSSLTPHILLLVETCKEK